MLKTSLIAAVLMSLSVSAHAASYHLKVANGKASKSIDGGPFKEIGKDKKVHNYYKTHKKPGHNNFNDDDYDYGHHDSNLKGLAKANAKKEFCDRNPENHRCDRDDNGISYKDFMKLAEKAGAKDAVKIDGKYFAICSSSAVDPDGDTWGWENNQSCKVI